MTRSLRTLSVAVLVCVLAAGCGRRAPEEPPVATPGFSISRQRVPLGSPVEVTYRFEVAPTAKFDGDYRVFVHFLDSEDELMWTDDHDPAPPTRQWKPGQRIEYTHTMFTPVYPYLGETRVRMGLYSAQTGRRLRLSGKEVGDREYEVGTFTLAPASENIFLVYRDGWHPPETPAGSPGREWQWTKKTATVSFRNPKRELVLYLEADGRPDVFDPPQQVSIRVGDRVIYTFPMTDDRPTVRKIPIPAAALGEGDTVDLRIEVDRTFTPSAIPPGRPGHGKDVRELGIRVFRLFVGPA
ncbi:MAG TPA: hypothetical protein VNK92_02020 [Vicinamibacterales bacterium]|nr:hypothetical protein [Vicinamibacterales bacterium]